MLEELILRGAWVLVLIGSGAVLYGLANRLILLRARLLNSPSSRSSPTFPGKGKPVILYFTSPTCVPCKTVQRPVIEKLQAQHGDSLEVVEIDASAQADIAGRWGVMSVPTTFVLDLEGRPRYVNHGIATSDKLANQIRELMPADSLR
jgi:thiol-disulfide isomerase/thioredoxin